MDCSEISQSNSMRVPQSLWKVNWGKDGIALSRLSFSSGSTTIVIMEKFANGNRLRYTEFSNPQWRSWLMQRLSFLGLYIDCICCHSSFDPQDHFVLAVDQARTSVLSSMHWLLECTSFDSVPSTSLWNSMMSYFLEYGQKNRWPCDKTNTSV